MKTAVSSAYFDTWGESYIETLAMIDILVARVFRDFFLTSCHTRFAPQPRPALLWSDIALSHLLGDRTIH